MHSSANYSHLLSAASGKNKFGTAVQSFAAAAAAARELFDSPSARTVRRSRSSTASWFSVTRGSLRDGLVRREIICRGEGLDFLVFALVGGDFGLGVTRVEEGLLL